MASLQDKLNQRLDEINKEEEDLDDNQNSKAQTYDFYAGEVSYSGLFRLITYPVIAWLILKGLQFLSTNGAV